MPTPPEPPQDPEFFRYYAENEVALHTYVRSLLTTREDAAEVMQQVMIALWTGYRQAAEFRPWAFGVARNLAMMHLRTRSRDRHVFDEELVARVAESYQRESSRLAEERDALQGCLQKLPAEQRELVLAAYSKEVRIDELARRQGRTAMSLYKLLQRIRQALLECIQRSLARGEIT
jgi:RNA polymerase sigma-70 factor (ECF subfamily)